VLLTVLPEIFRSAAEYRMLLYGLAVVVIIVLKPSGLMGYREFSLRPIFTLYERIFKKNKSAQAGGDGE
jgi:branched-chain amino acid transport system permease protein